MRSGRLYQELYNRSPVVSQMINFSFVLSSSFRYPYTTPVAVIAAKREDVILDNHLDEGAVAGTAREALSQIMTKALGFNIGGKIGIAHYKDHLVVAVFMEIDLLHLDEVAIGLGHRALLHC